MSLSRGHKRGPGRSRNAHRGAAIVEFAIIFPILCTVLFGIIQLGLLVNAYVSVTNSAREGARAAVAYRNQTAIDAERRQAARVAIYGHDDASLPNPTGMASLVGYLADWDDSDVTFASSAPSATNPLRSGEPLTVTVHYRYDVAFGMVPQIPPLDIVAQSSMTIE